MTLEQFAATRRPVTDKTWTGIIEAVDNPAPREHFREYGDGFVLHHAAGERIFVHAWWREPLSYPTIAEAEAALFEWWQEFN